MGLCSCFSSRNDAKKPAAAQSDAMANGVAPPAAAAPLDRVSAASFASAESFVSAQSHLSAASNITGVSGTSAPGGTQADRGMDDTAGLSPEHAEAVTELRRRVAEPRTGGGGGGGDKSSLAEDLRRTGEVVDDACLKRWLVARTWDVHKAEHGLQEHATWRRDFAIGSVTEDMITRELEMKKTFVQGCDGKGHSVLVILAKQHAAKKRLIEETQRFIVYALDHTITVASKSAERFVVLFDLSGFGYSNFDFKALLSCFDLLQNHYPERMEQLWFLNAPRLFWGLWKMVAPLVDPATRSKIDFVQGEEGLANLRQLIPAQVLPKAYGGQAELISVEDSVAALRAKQRQ